jgi:hypothetical protein
MREGAELERVREVFQTLLAGEAARAHGANQDNLRSHLRRLRDV